MPIIHFVCPTHPSPQILHHHCLQFLPGITLVLLFVFRIRIAHNTPCLPPSPLQSPCRLAPPLFLISPGYYKGKYNLPRAPLAFLSRLKLPFPKLLFPSLSNACHAGCPKCEAIMKTMAIGASSLLFFFAKLLSKIITPYVTHIVTSLFAIALAGISTGRILR